MGQTVLTEATTVASTECRRATERTPARMLVIPVRMPVMPAKMLAREPARVPVILAREPARVSVRIERRSRRRGRKATMTLLRQ